MLRALRRTRLAWLFVTLALLATMPVTVSSLLHDDSDDTICNPPVVVHDASSHRIGGAEQTPFDPHHCVLCHAWQLLRAVQPSVRFAPPLLDTRLPALDLAPSARTLFVSTGPARAPPLG